MTRTKLTLRLEEQLIVRAKQWARKRGVSLSQAVATLFEQLAAAGEGNLSPWTQQLVGIARRKKRRRFSDEAVRRSYLDHLERKHR